MEKTVFTLGTSTRSMEEFIEILKHYKIQVVFDVRRFPTSKHEHFKKENMKKCLEESGIEYRYLGDKLGGYRKGGYKNYMHTEEYMRGIKEIEKEKRRKCIVCAERFPWRCHRRYISRTLEERGWRVVHILEKGKTWEPTPLFPR
ncbi:DUF488 domain-containing protein [bacterium]|nr:MAG: DUF488 domain-containing protein [bacterium]